MRLRVSPFIVLAQPEAGVREAGQREDGDAEALHHGESSQLLATAGFPAQCRRLGATKGSRES